MQAALASVPIILLREVVRSTLGNVFDYKGQIIFCRPIFKSNAGVLYIVKNGSSFIMSKRISVIPDNWHFNSSFVL